MKQSQVVVPSLHYLRMLEGRRAVGTWALHPSTGVMTWSSGLRRMMRLGDDAAPGVDALLAAVHPQDRWIVGELMQTALRPAPERRYRVAWPDGAIRWHACFTDTLEDAHGRAPVLTAVVEDVTTSHLYEAALARDRRSHDGLIALSGAVSWRADALGVLDRAESWRLFTGQSYGQMQAGGWLLALHPDDQADAAREHAAARAAARPAILNVRVRRHDGVAIPLALRLAPAPAPEGGPCDWIAFAALPGEPDARRPAQPAAAGAVGAAPSPAQLRGSRGLLDWTVAELATASGVSAATIARYEAGVDDGARARPSTLLKLRAALQAAGVEFLEDGAGPAGIRLGT